LKEIGVEREGRGLGVGEMEMVGRVAEGLGGD